MQLPDPFALWVGGVASLVLFGAFVFLSFAVMARALPHARWDVHLLGVSVTCAWWMSVTFHLLIGVGAFRLGPAVLLVGLTTMVVAYTTGYGLADFRRDAARDVRGAWRLGRVAFAGPWRILIPLLLVGVVALGWRAFLLVPWSWDTVTYHAVKAALWVQDGGPIGLEAPGGWAIYRYYFAGGELFWAWAMLPFRSDFLFGLVDWAGWLTLGLAVWTLARLVGVRAPLRLVAVVYVLALPAVLRSVGSGYVENLLYTLLLAAVVFAIRYRKRGQGGDLVLMGTAFGLSCAVKITALSYVCAILGVLAAFEIRRPILGLRGWRPLSLGGLAGAVVWLPWIVDNLQGSGAPLGTIPLNIGPWQLGRLVPEMAWYLDRPDLIPYTLAEELRVLRQLFAPPVVQFPHLSLFSLPLVLAGLLGTAAAWRRSPAAVSTTGVVGLVALLNVYQPSFVVARLGWGAVTGRFLLPFAIVTILYLLLWMQGSGRRTVVVTSYMLGVALIHAGALLLTGWSARMVILVSGLTVITMVLLDPWVQRRVRSIPTGWMVPALLAFVVGLPAFAKWKETNRHTILASNEVLHPMYGYWFGAPRHVDRPEQPLRIAYTGGRQQAQDNMPIYHFLGSRLQNRILYVPSSLDGGIIAHGPPEDRSSERSFERWSERLEVAGVTHVMSFCPRSTEVGWMLEHPDQFRYVAGDGAEWGLFEVGAFDLQTARSAPDGPGCIY